ncbi:fructose-bisphosphate aldolase [Lactarius hatsudake]|nr:fructose-bisphosphate aldolase [Lactarius hatsudake]
MGVLDIVPPGVLTGDNVRKLFQYAQEHKFAIPAINVTSSSTANAALEAARDIKSPVILQVSQGGSAYFAGKGLANDKQQASIIGAIAAAHHIRTVAKAYGVYVASVSCTPTTVPKSSFLGSMACSKQTKRTSSSTKEALFSSHMLDLSEEPKDQNIATCVKYFKRMAPLGIWLEMEIGITGGEEDGVDNTGVDNNSLYTQPDEVYDVYAALSPISPNFSIAAAFGNVHGVYKPGNVRLHPELLAKHQAYAKEKVGGKVEKPLFLVFHGGSGSSKEEIQTAVNHGVVKMNVDTWSVFPYQRLFEDLDSRIDTQFAYLAGIRDFVLKKKDYLLTQVGNPEGADKPNKKFYDPRVWVREGEKTLTERVKVACQDLGNVNRL